MKLLEAPAPFLTFNLFYTLAILLFYLLEFFLLCHRCRVITFGVHHLENILLDIVFLA